MPIKSQEDLFKQLTTFNGFTRISDRLVAYKDSRDVIAVSIIADEVTIMSEVNVSPTASTAAKKTLRITDTFSWDNLFQEIVALF